MSNSNLDHVQAQDKKTDPQQSSCCSAKKQATCCEQKDKAECCGPEKISNGGCGCQ